MRRFTPYYNHGDTENLLRADKRMGAIFKNLPKWRQDLTRYKTGRKSSKRMKDAYANAEPQRHAREEAEMQAAATVRQCIKSLEMAIEAVNANPAPAKYQRHVLMLGLVDAVFHLRNKCGVN